jgi:hypothetical protein
MNKTSKLAIPLSQKTSMSDIHFLIGLTWILIMFFHSCLLFRSSRFMIIKTIVYNSSDFLRILISTKISLLAHHTSLFFVKDFLQIPNFQPHNIFWFYKFQICIIFKLHFQPLFHLQTRFFLLVSIFFKLFTFFHPIFWYFWIIFVIQFQFWFFPSRLSRSRSERIMVANGRYFEFNVICIVNVPVDALRWR